MKEGFLMKKNNIFWGIIFLLSAVLIIANQVGAFSEIGIFTIVASILLIAIFIQSLFSLNFFGAFLSVVVGYIIFSGPLNLPYISPYILFLSAVLLSIGFSIIFKGRKIKNYNCCNNNTQFINTTEEIEDNFPQAKVSFSSAEKHLYSEGLVKGNFSVSFGEMHLFFDNVKLSSDKAEIFVNCNFGSLKIYVPNNYKIIENVNVNLDSIKNNISASAVNDSSPNLTISGNVSLGEIEINYI